MPFCLGERIIPFQCNVHLLDQTIFSTELKSSAKGGNLFAQVCDHLKLNDIDYFGLRYLDANKQSHWLDHGRSLSSQLPSSRPTVSTSSSSGVDTNTSSTSSSTEIRSYNLYFGVKFYLADPCKIQNEITRYLFFLQTRTDVQDGRLAVSYEEAAELGALAVQSELGDYDPKRNGLNYLDDWTFMPQQPPDLTTKVAEIHKSLIGKLPAAVEYLYLEKVKWMDTYGVDFHIVRGEGSMEYSLGLCPTGVVVYKGKNKVGHYFWPRIAKITYKGKLFILRIRDKNNEENTYAFECASKSACLHLWKCTIEHHAFFRLTQAADTGRNKGPQNMRNGRVNHGNGVAGIDSAEAGPILSRQSSRAAVLRHSSNVYRSDRSINSTSYGVGHANESSTHQKGSDAVSVQSFRSTSNPPGGQTKIPGTTTTTTHTGILTPKPVNTASVPLRNGYLSSGEGGGGVTGGRVGGVSRGGVGDQEDEDEGGLSRPSAPWENEKDRGGLYTSGRDSPQSIRSDRIKFPRRIPSASDIMSDHHRHSARERGGSGRRSRASAHRQAIRDSDNEAGVGVASLHHHNRRRKDGGIPYHRRHRSAGDDPRIERYYGHRNRGGVDLISESETGGAGTDVGSENISIGEYNRRRRKHHHRSKSPGQLSAQSSKSKQPPQEILQHIQYGLVEPTEGADHKDIPYTNVICRNFPRAQSSPFLNYPLYYHDSTDSAVPRIHRRSNTGGLIASSATAAGVTANPPISSKPPLVSPLTKQHQQQQQNHSQSYHDLPTKASMPPSLPPSRVTTDYRHHLNSNRPRDQNDNVILRDDVDNNDDNRDNLKQDDVSAQRSSSQYQRQPGGSSLTSELPMPPHSSPQAPIVSSTPPRDGRHSQRQQYQTRFSSTNESPMSLSSHQQMPTVIPSRTIASYDIRSSVANGAAIINNNNSGINNNNDNSKFYPSQKRMLSSSSSQQSTDNVASNRRSVLPPPPRPSVLSQRHYRAAVGRGSKISSSGTNIQQQQPGLSGSGGGGGILNHYRSDTEILTNPVYGNHPSSSIHSNSRHQYYLPPNARHHQPNNIINDTSNTSKYGRSAYGTSVQQQQSSMSKYSYLANRAGLYLPPDRDGNQSQSQSSATIVSQQHDGSLQQQQQPQGLTNNTAQQFSSLTQPQSYLTTSLHDGITNKTSDGSGIATNTARGLPYHDYANMPPLQHTKDSSFSNNPYIEQVTGVTADGKILIRNNNDNTINNTQPGRNNVVAQNLDNNNTVAFTSRDFPPNPYHVNDSPTSNKFNRFSSNAVSSSYHRGPSSLVSASYGGGGYASSSALLQPRTNYPYPQLIRQQQSASAVIDDRRVPPLQQQQQQRFFGASPPFSTINSNNNNNISTPSTHKIINSNNNNNNFNNNNLYQNIPPPSSSNDNGHIVVSPSISNNSTDKYSFMAASCNVGGSPYRKIISASSEQRS